ncbi:DUF5701 family protein [Dietzia timorensis]|uniref:Uncharacterized protein n=1 Tax=Dietzia timorensis TaxID=499555 RepID=A0A173LRC4_9ACTN|nr:DUF5701 family protein [Dietzia timorensis]ANI93542.1 Hypothetical protein BJL86_2782 [Dietzia timorensis]
MNGQTLPTIVEQVDALVRKGLPALASMGEDEFRKLASGLGNARGGIVAVHPSLVPAASLAPLLERAGRPGFVVEDMTDLAEFAPIAGVEIPDAPLYVLAEPQRGDDMRNWSPDEALPEITARGRTPLTVSEGICWLLAEPAQLEPNHCFMTIASRKPKARQPKSQKGVALDARTPALWISGGTGQDGAERKGAPKVGWCWAGNRHTWLGFASVARRTS